MFGFIKGITKTAVLATLSVGAITGGSLLLAGPGRTMAVAHELKSKVTSVIDRNLDDPIALRRQLVEVEREYPERISEVRQDLAGLRADIARLEQEQAVCTRVVALASEDLEALVQDEAHAQPTSARARRGAVSSRARHLEQIILANEGKALDATADLQALASQESRMVQVLEQLESERAQFQVQLTQLERQVASIARNDRMIELMERRQRTLDKIRSWDAVSLDQIQGRIASIRAEQEARLEVLTQDHEQVDYEAMARQELSSEGRQGL
ncbi:MAG: hypothetical protein O2799_06885 [Planctomycetota bacterium]|nr:hypothetical protein [Planctomycetota bacterium]